MAPVFSSHQALNPWGLTDSGYEGVCGSSLFLSDLGFRVLAFGVQMKVLSA